MNGLVQLLFIVLGYGMILLIEYIGKFQFENLENFLQTKVDIFICCFFLQSNQMELILDGDNGVTDRLLHLVKLKDFLASTSKRFLMNKYTINIPI